MKETVLDKTKKEPSPIYHYTNMEALKGILQKDKLCFWGTRYDSMNDPTEYIYAKNILTPMFRKHFSLEEDDEVDAYPYIVSFCKEGDDFMMWRMYKAEVALVLDSNRIQEWIEAIHIQEMRDYKEIRDFYYFGECKYPQNETEVFEAFDEIKRWNEKDGDMSKDELTAFELTTFIKRQQFKNENEVRLFTCDYSLPSGCYNEEDPANPLINYEERSKNIGIKSVREKDFILYKEFHLPKDALMGLILNCEEGNQFNKIKRHIQAWLYQLNYNISDDAIRPTKTGNLIINL